jgi:hypothetical protein
MSLFNYRTNDHYLPPASNAVIDGISGFQQTERSEDSLFVKLMSETTNEKRVGSIPRAARETDKIIDSGPRKETVDPLAKALELMKDKSIGSVGKRLLAALPHFEEAIKRSDQIDREAEFFQALSKTSLVKVKIALEEIAKAQLRTGTQTPSMLETDTMLLIEQLREPGKARLEYAKALNVVSATTGNSKYNLQALGVLRELVQKDPVYGSDLYVRGAIRLLESGNSDLISETEAINIAAGNLRISSNELLIRYAAETATWLFGIWVANMVLDQIKNVITSVSREVTSGLRGETGHTSVISTAPKAGERVLVEGRDYRFLAIDGENWLLYDKTREGVAIAKPISPKELTENYSRVELEVNGIRQTRYCLKDNRSQWFHVFEANGTTYISADPAIVPVATRSAAPANTGETQPPRAEQATGPTSNESKPLEQAAEGAKHRPGGERPRPVYDTNLTEEERRKIKERVDLVFLRRQTTLEEGEIALLEEKARSLSESSSLAEKTAGDQLSKLTETLRGKSGPEAAKTAHKAVIDHWIKSLERKATSRATGPVVGAGILIAAALGAWRYMNSSEPNVLRRAQIRRTD